MKFLDNFFKKMQKRGVIYTEAEREDFKNLYNILEKNNLNKVVAVPIPMGRGKSTFIKEYSKYKMKEDPNWNNVIANKTINECIDSCLDIGIIKGHQDEIKDMDIEKQRTFYRGLVKNGYIAKNPHPHLFKAVTIMGFNKNDCIIYSRHKKSMVERKPVTEIEDLEREEKFQELSEAFEEFCDPMDYSMCIECKKMCLRNLTRFIAEKKNTLLISHSRLILSNDFEEMLLLVKDFDSKGQKTKRKQLVIDEKIKIADIENLDMKKLEKAKKYIEKYGKKEEVKIVQDIIDTFDSFQKPIKRNDLIRKNISNSFPILRLCEKTEEKLLKAPTSAKEVIEILKILNRYQICIISEKYRVPKKEKEKREFTIARYLSPFKYKDDFLNIVILDATAGIDIEYDKAGVKIAKKSKKGKSKINLFLPTNECNVSKASIEYHIQEDRDKEIIENIASECDNIIEKTGKKTLIVAYKTLFGKMDFKEMIREYITSEDDKYKIIHFGQFTTGVNFLSDYENIVFIGQLRKIPAYYRAKSIIISDDNVQYSDNAVQENEMLIDTIQQIGRTCYRKGKVPNVYLFDSPKILGVLKKGLGQFFETFEQDYENKYFFKERKDYESEKRDVNSYMNKFFEYVFYELQSRVEQFGIIIEKELKIPINKIKEAIGYKSRNFARDITNKAKEATSENTVMYDKKNKVIVINLDELLKCNTNS